MATKKEGAKTPKEKKSIQLIREARSARQRSSRTSLRQEGGTIVQVRLNSEAAADLVRITSRDGISKKDAIINALHTEANKVR